jgi:hypothetical protein
MESLESQERWTRQRRGQEEGDGGSDGVRRGVAEGTL